MTIICGVYVNSCLLTHPEFLNIGMILDHIQKKKTYLYRYIFGIFLTLFADNMKKLLAYGFRETITS